MTVPSGLSFVASKGVKMAEVEDASVTVGSVLSEFILPLPGVTQGKLATALGVSRLTVNELLNDKRTITPAMALRLAKALSTTPDFWLNVQRDVDLAKARSELAGQLDAVPVLRPIATREDVVGPFDELFGGAGKA
jgi:addiction module HigA family antidote